VKARKDRPEKKLVINVPPIMQRLTTFQIIKRAIWVWLDKKSYKKAPAKDPGAGMPQMHAWSNVSHFAVVVDEDVVDVMRVQPRMAAWLQSGPRFVMFDPEVEFTIRPGTKYVDGKFVDPDINLNLSPQQFPMKEK
jgi:hypothetical protein